MPRRNLFVLVIVTAAALVCHRQAITNRYGRIAAEALTVIESRYIEPVNGRGLFEAAMQGMVQRLDENSAYVAHDQLPDFHKTIDQQFGGLGISVTLDPHTRRLVVLSPLVGSPAYRAGSRAGDAILSSDGQSTQGLSLQEAVARLGGPPGQAVVLSILHENESTPVDVQIVREIIRVPTVLGDLRDADGAWNFLLPGRDRIGYVRIVGFTDATPDELRKALRQLAQRGARGLVLDLRDNPGGYLDATVEVCRMFIGSGEIVSIRRRGGQVSETYSAGGARPLCDLPMAVLVNQQTASAAEITAACLQDHGRAVVFGQRTFGKGTVQEVIPLEADGGLLKITTASYWRPSGKNIQRPADDAGDWGVAPRPDGLVEQKPEEQNRWRQQRAQRDIVSDSAQAESLDDRVLRKAVDFLEKQAQTVPE